MGLKYACGIAPGISSDEEEVKIQDKAGFINENGVAVISLAGPAKMAESIGFRVELASEAAASLLTERFDELYSSEDAFVKKTILEHTGEAVWGLGIALSGMDCTLLFVAVKENRYLAGHMGGGLIARLHDGGSLLSGPESDPIHEGTDLTAEDHAMATLRIYRGELAEPFGFLLMSEGAGQSLYNFGTGDLSPACGTFFEWLQEYDEETVSEALTDNINKYFLKDIKGDLSVAIMVSEEDDAAIAADNAAEAEPPAVENGDGRKSGKGGKALKFLIALIVVLAVILVIALRPQGIGDQKEPGEAEPEAEAAVTNSAVLEPSVTFAASNPESYDAGEYQAGVDIPAGEYFFWTGESLKPGSITVNGDSALSGELYCMTIRLDEWDTLISDVRFTAAENINPVKALDGVLISGKYKIGKDIAPGTHTVKPTDENTAGRYYSIFDEEISNDTEINGETTVAVPEEGYVVFYNAILAVGE